jgi:hypothetical protein
MDEGDRADTELGPAEQARIRRRERERTAQVRELMRTGQAKAFKQILDAQARRATEAAVRSGDAAQERLSTRSSRRRHGGRPDPSDGDDRRRRADDHEQQQADTDDGDRRPTSR